MPIRRSTCQLVVEEPDRVAQIDFLNYCQVRLEVADNPNQLRVTVLALDDRSSIVMDESIALPYADEKDQLGPS